MLLRGSGRRKTPRSMPWRVAAATLKDRFHLFPRESLTNGTIRQCNYALEPALIGVFIRRSRFIHARHNDQTRHLRRHRRSLDRTPPRLRHAARHHARRRLCLAARRELAGGVPRPVPARSGDPHPSRSRERLPGRADGRHGGAAQEAVRGDEGPHQGGRFLGADEGRPLSPTARPSRTAASSRAISASRATAAPKRSSSTATRRPKARPISASAASTIPPTIARLIWGFDDKGSEFYTLRVRDLATGSELADVVDDTGGSGVWDAANNGFFYTRLDPNHRPSKVFYHALGTDTAIRPAGLRGDRPRLLHECRRHALQRLDHDLASTITRPRNTGCSRPADPLAEPKLVAARETGLQYDLEEGGDIFFILTNADGAKDFKIMTAPVERPGPGQLEGTRAARARPADPVGHRLQGLHGPPRAQGGPAAHRRARARDRRGASHRLRRGGLLARPVGFLRIRHRRSCASPIRR